MDHKAAGGVVMDSPGCTPVRHLLHTSPTRMGCMWRYSQAPGAAAAGARSLDCGGSRCASTAVAAAAPHQAPLVLGVA